MCQTRGEPLGTSLQKLYTSTAGGFPISWLDRHMHFGGIHHAYAVTRRCLCELLWQGHDRGIHMKCRHWHADHHSRSHYTQPSPQGTQRHFIRWLLVLTTRRSTQCELKMRCNRTGGRQADTIFGIERCCSIVQSNLFASSSNAPVRQPHTEQWHPCLGTSQADLLPRPLSVCYRACMHV